MIHPYAERETDTHIFFLRGLFSNFEACSKLIVRDVSFKTTEHAFMWLKALHFKDNKTANEILLAATPGEAKKLGRGVVGFNVKEWSAVCYAYMLEVNLAKYTQNIAYANVLLSTTKTLVETNGKDTIWGIGLFSKDDRVLNEATWQGTNLLGKVLMEVRTLLRVDILEQQIKRHTQKIKELTQSIQNISMKSHELSVESRWNIFTKVVDNLPAASCILHLKTLYKDTIGYNAFFHVESRDYLVKYTEIVEQLVEGFYFWFDNQTSNPLPKTIEKMIEDGSELLGITETAEYDSRILESFFKQLDAIKIEMMATGYKGFHYDW